MKRYEQLMIKSENCLEAAKITEGFIQKIWLRNAEMLKNKALNLSWEEANQEVKDVAAISL